MTENEPTAEELRRAWLRELIARSQPHSRRFIFAPEPPTTDNNRSK
ncbi:hypothetical protein [Nocardioides lijunqiniae]|nr:hypothetical protein [Nocardioides lijunqiniae]